MRNEQETTQLLRDWLAETLSSVPPPDATVTEVLRRLPSTPQADGPGPGPGSPVGIGGGGWLGRGGLPVAAKLGIAGLAVATSVTLGFLLRDQLPGLIDHPTPTPVPTGQRTLIVDPADRAGYRTISAAVRDATDGDVVLVRPGQYAERVVVSADITIMGDGPRAAIVVRAVDAPADPAVTPAGRVERNAFILDHTRATLRGLTITGPQVASAVWIHGGAPTLEDLTIDLDGDETGATPVAPHENISVDGRSRAIVQRSTLDGFVSIGDGSPVTFTDNAITGGCVYILDAGTVATVSGNTFKDSGCPTFTIGVRLGATPLIEGNTIDGGTINGLEIVGDGSDAIVRSNTIRDLPTGIWTSGTSQPLLQDNVLDGNDTGIEVVSGRATIHGNRLSHGGIGVALRGGAEADLADNVFVGNDIGLVSDGATPGIEVHGGAWCDNGRDLDVPTGPAPVVSGAGGCEAAPSPSADP